MQGIFSDFKLAAAWLGLVGLGVPCAAAVDEDLSKNIVVLVDSSMSVDPANRDSALRLVAGLITGNVDERSRKQWTFERTQNGADPMVANLANLMAPGADPGRAIASENASFVISPLGNYQRVVDLRRQLAQQASPGTPREIATRLQTDKFTTEDGSTHLKLAEAVVAEAFLKSSSEKPYYLVVISDFHEDCINSNKKVYADPNANQLLDEANKKVYTGEIPYKDSETKTGHYEAADIAAIQFHTEKISTLEIGMINYKPEPAAGKLRVNVKIYSPRLNRCGLRFAAETQQWVFPDSPPVLAIELVGAERMAKLKLLLRHQADGTEGTLEGSLSEMLSDKGLDLGRLVKGGLIKNFPRPGKYDITLSAEQVPDPAVPAKEVPPAKTVLAIDVPVLTFADPKLAARVSEDDPLVLPANWKADKEDFTIKLKPKPTQKCSIDLKFGKLAAKPFNVVAGEVHIPATELPITELSEGGGKSKAVDRSRAVSLSASLNLKYIESAAKTQKVWLKLPEPWIRVECPGATIDKDGKIQLPRGGGLVTLTAAYENCEGMDWRSTEVRPRVGNDNITNKINFSNKEPATYKITTRFGREGDTLEPKTFIVVVPKNPPWPLIAMGVTLGLGLGLFGWHFFRRR